MGDLMCNEWKELDRGDTLTL